METTGRPRFIRLKNPNKPNLPPSSLAHKLRPCTELAPLPSKPRAVQTVETSWKEDLLKACQEPTNQPSLPTSQLNTPDLGFDNSFWDELGFDQVPEVEEKKDVNPIKESDIMSAPVIIATDSETMEWSDDMGAVSLAEVEGRASTKPTKTSKILVEENKKEMEPKDLDLLWGDSLLSSNPPNLSIPENPDIPTEGFDIVQFAVGETGINVEEEVDFNWQNDNVVDQILTVNPAQIEAELPAGANVWSQDIPVGADISIVADSEEMDQEFLKTNTQAAPAGTSEGTAVLEDLIEVLEVEKPKKRVGRRPRKLVGVQKPKTGKPVGRPERKTRLEITKITKDQLKVLPKEKLNDLKYRRMRDLNNESSKKCRQNRKQKNREQEELIKQLQGEKAIQEEQVLRLERAVSIMKRKIAAAGIIQRLNV